jgi:UvrA-like protein
VTDGWYWHTYAQSGRFDLDKPLRDYTDEEWKLLFYGADEKVTLQVVGRKSMKVDFEGVETKFHRLFVDVEEASDGKRRRWRRSPRPCAARAARAPGWRRRPAWPPSRDTPCPRSPRSTWNPCTCCCRPWATQTWRLWWTRRWRGSAR